MLKVEALVLCGFSLSGVFVLHYAFFFSFCLLPSAHLSGGKSIFKFMSSHTSLLGLVLLDGGEVNINFVK